MRLILSFSIVTLTPVGLLVLALWQGGIWAWAALIYLALFGYLADAIFGSFDVVAPSPVLRVGLPAALGVAHFGLIFAGAWALAGDWLDFADKIPLALALALFLGATSNAVAHELIHRSARWQHSLGKWMFISMLFGHHTSAHVLVHHRFVATRQDPNSARLDEGFYRFWARAWRGSFRKGLQAENDRRAKAKVGGLHPYALYALGALACVAVATALWGGAAGAVYIGLAIAGHSGLLLTDYIQHYGLQRAFDDRGKPVPVGPQHSWNSRHWFIAHLTVNAVRHSDHHMKPARPFDELEPGVDAPQLPCSAALMSLIALVPPLWRRMMNPCVAAVSDGAGA